MNNKIILIYQDSGVSKIGVGQWVLRCKNWNTPYQRINASNIKDGALLTADILIISGGADLPYYEKLSGKGTNNIKEFVNNGGIYIGCCAGAYFAHRNITWDNNGEKINGQRDLGFFDGTATGPLEKPYNSETSEGLIFVPVFYSNNNKIKAMAYYKGGPAMAVDNDTTIIAKFIHKTNHYPAIISKPVGKGLVIGMSPHMEYTDCFMDSINAPLCKNRNDMFLNIFENLLFK